MAFAAGIPLALATMGAGAMSYYSTAKANKQNIALAQRQMDFQNMMSSTAYQRAMQDMKKAGINPILAYSQGGASTPSGASTQVQPALERGVSSARESMRSSLEYSLLKAQASMASSQARIAKQQAEIQTSPAGEASTWAQTVFGAIKDVLPWLLMFTKLKR